MNLRFEPAPYVSSLRVKPIGVTLYMVDEAIRGVVPPTEWEHREHFQWLEGFVKRLHHRFVRLLTEEQRETILNLADAPLEEMHSFFLDPQVEFRKDRYLPDPDRNAVSYLKRAYGLGAARELCARVKEQTMLDPSEVICYSVEGNLRFLESIW